MAEGEFEKQLSIQENSKTIRDRFLALTAMAAKEFPCQACPSKDGCASFEWFKKWFGDSSQIKE